jgi:hypothetical protein
MTSTMSGLVMYTVLNARANRIDLDMPLRSKIVWVGGPATKMSVLSEGDGFAACWASAPAIEPTNIAANTTPRARRSPEFVSMLI